MNSQAVGNTTQGASGFISSEAIKPAIIIVGKYGDYSVTNLLLGKGVNGSCYLGIDEVNGERVAVKETIQYYNSAFQLSAREIEVYESTEGSEFFVQMKANFTERHIMSQYDEPPAEIVMELADCSLDHLIHYSLCEEIGFSIENWDFTGLQIVQTLNELKKES